MKPMNDPHVTALHYWVEHDDSVDYDNAVPLDYEDDHVEVHLEKRQLTLRPKKHYASAQEARGFLEGFIRNWEFDAALEAGTREFELKYMDTDICDRNPTPPPPGVVGLSMSARTGPPKANLKLRVGKAKFPSPPAGLELDSSNPTAIAMLSRLDRYLQGRETLAAMSYFCLTVMADGVPVAKRTTDTKKAVRDYYRISVEVQKKVSALSSGKGGNEARKAEGLQQEFTDEDKKFLLMSVQAFTRRVAERAANPETNLEMITMADMPRLP